jgi:hypothetical protein
MGCDWVGSFYLATPKNLKDKNLHSCIKIGDR